MLLNKSTGYAILPVRSPAWSWITNSCTESIGLGSIDLGLSEAALEQVLGTSAEI